jgi:hypothetical protein
MYYNNILGWFKISKICDLFLNNKNNERENKSNHISAIRNIRFLLRIPALRRLCMARSFLNSNVPNSKMEIDWDDFNVKADYVIETVVKPQVEKYEQSILIEMKATELIKELIKELTIENSERCVEINELKKEIQKLELEKRKLQSELNFRKNTIEL